MTQERVAYVNGEIVLENQATVSISDRGFLLGDAVFDTTRTFGHKIFKLQEHLSRLYDSLKWMRIDPQMTMAEMADLTMDVLERNLPTVAEHEDIWVTQRVTRGLRLAGADIQGAAGRPTVIIECFPIPFQERAHYYRDGMPIVTPSVRRTPPEAMSPRAKTHNYINLIQADMEARAQNPHAYALLLDMNGNLCEGNGSNIFVVKDGAIRTPKSQYVLGGISRETTVELAHELDIEISEADIDVFDAYTSDEIFVTSTSLCICPVSTFNGATVGDGATPGPVTDRLQKAYSGLVDIDIIGQYTRWLE
jgi:branched-chain amino acid aminotransferase